ncbi:MAG TPA: hypothetical protein VEP49_11700 [Acidimicrobiia bacterium]|nr:hypothetical protein [Acidimicrobiia bacterium]
MVSVVGHGARACVERLGRGANVATMVPEPDDAALDRAVAAWTTATRVHTPYFAHDADPLDATASAWVRRYDERGPVGELEVAVSDTLARWRAGSLELPDYYLVLDAEAWAPTRRHWYLGVLHRAAPARVVPVANADVAEATLPRLGAGRWWPDLDELLDGIDRVVPDQVGAAQPDETAAAT